MPKSTCLLASILASGALVGLSAAHASNVSNSQIQKSCAGAKTSAGQSCTADKTAAQPAQPGLLKIAHSGFDRNGCHLLASKVARDTCLNHFDGSA
jgi:hypothetical protein